MKGEYSESTQWNLPHLMRQVIRNIKTLAEVKIYNTRFLNMAENRLNDTT